jgi:hypothetical protein
VLSCVLVGLDLSLDNISYFIVIGWLYILSVLFLISQISFVYGLRAIWGSSRLFLVVGTYCISIIHAGPVCTNLGFYTISGIRAGVRWYGCVVRFQLEQEHDKSYYSIRFLD